MIKLNNGEREGFIVFDIEGMTPRERAEMRKMRCHGIFVARIKNGLLIWEPKR